jgi:hypothetical protein
MADEDSSGGGSGIIWVILIILIVLVINVPIVSEIIFKWIPATVDVISGQDAPGIGSPNAIAESGSIGEPNVVVSSNESEGPNPPIDLNGSESGSISVYESDTFIGEDSSLFSAWSIFVPISIFASLLLAIGLVYSLIRMSQIRKKEKSELMEIMHPIASGNVTKAQMRWKEIVDHSQSDNQNDWRAAIIEADIMLDELLEAQGYRGDTMGDKMKTIERSDFNTIDAAWEAHKARNQIAHEGAGFELNQREIRRIVELYERVFREFRFI